MTHTHAAHITICLDATKPHSHVCLNELERWLETLVAMVQCIKTTLEPKGVECLPQGHNK